MSDEAYIEHIFGIYSAYIEHILETRDNLEEKNDYFRKNLAYVKKKLYLCGRF